jgi:competence protein ComEC
MVAFGWLVVLFGFVLGVAVESVYDFGFAVALWLSLLALVISLCWRRMQTVRPALSVFYLSLMLVGSALGLMRTQYFEAQFDDSLSASVGQEISFDGQVLLDPDVRSNQQLLTVQSDTERILVVTDRTIPVAYGDTVRVSGRLEVPQSFTTELGRTFDYATYLKAKQIEYRVSFAEVIVLETDGGNPIIAGLLQLKHQLLFGLDNVLTEPQGSLADGLLLGLNQGLGDELEQDFRRSGIVHIVVLSGYNVMLVVTFVLFVLAFFLPRPAQLIVGLLAILSFALIVGLSATVVRASIMAALFLIAQSFGRTYAVLRALLVAGALMIFVNPYLLLYDIGFQLSFMATLGLVAALPWLTNESHFEIMASARGYIVATIATQIAVLPLLVFHIGEVSAVAVIVNLLVLPVVPFAMLGSFIAGTLWFVLPNVALVFGYVTQILLSYIIAVASFFANVPFATMQVGVVSLWWVPLLYSMLGCLYWWVCKQRPAKKVAVNDWIIVDEDSLKRADNSDTQSKATSSSETVPKWFR